MMHKAYIIIIFVVVVAINFVSSADYCSLCENGTHTMCKYRGPSASCAGFRKKIFTAREKKYIVDIHNDIRNHVASGMEGRGGLGSQPSASDMSLLQWDNELAEIAQMWADQCIKINETEQHDLCKRTERFEVGQNILTAITDEPDVPELSILIFNWYQQVTNVIPSDIDIFQGVKKGKYLIGQYTQLVWAETRFVGCGIVTFTESDYEVGTYQHRLVCNYGPSGNIIGEPVYQRGRPCARCRPRNCDTIRTSLCQGTGSKEFSNKFDIVTNEDVLQSNNAHFSSNITAIFMKNINNAICLNPDESVVTKCITGISQSNITSPDNSLNMKDRLRYITLGALASNNIGLHNPDQTTLKNLRALWKKFKFKNITDSFNILLSNNWTETVTLEDKSNKPSTSTTVLNDLKNPGFIPKSAILVNFAKHATKSGGKRNKNIEPSEDLKYVTYISTVIPSTEVTISKFDKNITVLHSSQEAQKPLIIDKDFDIYGTTHKFRYKNIDLQYLENGIVLGNEGEKHYLHLKDPRHKVLQSYFRLHQDYDNMAGEMDYPENEHYQKARGVWHNGHCRCDEMERVIESSVENPKIAIFLFTATLLLVFSNIILRLT